MTTSAEEFLNQKVQIISIYKYLPMERFKYLFWNAHRKTIVEGKYAEKTLPELLPIMNGSMTVRDIIDTLSHIPPDDIVGTIEFLIDKDFVEVIDTDVEDIITEKVLRYFKHWFDYVKHLNIEPQKYLHLLRHSQVGLIFNGPMGISAGINLAAMGVGNIITVDKGTINSDDAKLCSHIGTEEVGEKRAYVFKRIVEESCPYVNVGIIDYDEESEAFFNLFDYSHFLILCDEDNRHVIPARVNEASMIAKKPFISATLTGFSGRIGPTVIPGETSCLECFHSREMANIESYEEHKIISETFSELSEEDYSYRPPAYFLSMMGELVASEAVKVISGYTEPSTLNKFLYIDCQSPNIQSHPVLKVPRCKMCSRLNIMPTLRAWGFK